ncbi:hypothetical protein [Mycoplasma sp. ATU-Cv-508]|uniref:hypothetical protein n=1 Tax=Mycoplasma sp. ATU-Cv-508 TaxID=2048001 RepID=UPI001F233917
MAHALEPAKIIAVQNKVDQYGRNVPNTKIAITPQVHQTLAIGRQGANVRLAVELTKVNIDILSLEQAREQNISFVWNGTLSENDLHRVSRTGRLPSESFDYRRSNHRSPRIDFTEIDDQIRSFQRGHNRAKRWRRAASAQFLSRFRNQLHGRRTQKNGSWVWPGLRF